MKRLVLLPYTMFLLVSGICSAANHYVLAGSSGSGNGSTWSTACSDLGKGGCSSLVRGDTYYIAGGTYGAQTLNTSPSGTAAIVIRGATVADHGTETGWSSGLSVCSADGGAPAQFPNGWQVSTGYWTVDGSCGGGAANNGTTQGYGFVTRSDAAGNAGLGFFFTTSVSGITISHYEIDGVNCCDIDSSAGGTDGMLCFGGCAVDGLFDHLYIHDVKRTFFLMGGNVTLQYSYLARNRSTSAQHAEAWSYRGGTPILHDNIIEDYRGTGGLVALGGTASNVEVYGNVFRMVQGACSGCNDGAQPVIDDTAGAIHGLKFYNNTIYGISGSAGIGCVSSSTGYDIQNNLWYSNSYGVSMCGGSTVQYNIFWNTYQFGGPGSNGTDTNHNTYICGAGSNCLGNVGNNNLPPSAAAVFVNSPSDLHLLASSVSGGAYCNPCSLLGTASAALDTLDMDGNPRSASGGWMIGAYGLGTRGNPSPPAPPTALKVTTN